MQLTVQILAILISLTLLLLVLRLVYARRLREGYALLWLLAALTLLALSIFGGLLTRVADLLGVDYPPSVLLVVGQLFGMVILLSQSVIISSLARKNRDLAQKLAILEWHLEQLRAEMGEKADRDNEPTLENDVSEEVLMALEESKVPQ